jgi:hypothetical protein
VSGLKIFFYSSILLLLGALVVGVFALANSNGIGGANSTQESSSNSSTEDNSDSGKALARLNDASECATILKVIGFSPERQVDTIKQASGLGSSSQFQDTTLDQKVKEFSRQVTRAMYFYDLYGDPDYLYAWPDQDAQDYFAARDDLKQYCKSRY